MTLSIGLPHSLGLVVLPVAMAVFGGYVGLGLVRPPDRNNGRKNNSM